MEPKQSNLFELQVDHLSSVYLRGAARWARFLSLVGFIFCGLSLFSAVLFATVLSGLIGSLGSGGLGMSGGRLAIVYICIAVLNFIPCRYLYNFATRMSLALDNNDQERLNNSFRNMRAFYRFVGVLMIACLGFWLLFIVGMLILTAGKAVA
ncbi:MAG TPA: hypothetical protein VNU70_13980 [Puia sp.]|jgi:hypothetical protein|nr:hypothetical protein [Puia sp.]